MSAAQSRAGRWSYVLDEPTRILVVDDDPILREFASVHLATPTAAVDTAADGEAALSKLAATPFDIVLLDIEMPRLDGFSMLERIRRDPARIRMPVIMLTGHDDMASIDRAYELGATSFATKPVNWRLLSYQIRYVLRATRSEMAAMIAYQRLRVSAEGNPGPRQGRGDSAVESDTGRGQSAGAECAGTDARSASRAVA